VSAGDIGGMTAEEARHWQAGSFPLIRDPA
jgi:hypothetical protein